MSSNVGRIDSLVRFVLGISVMVTGVAYHSHWGFAGLVIFITSFIHWCPIYKIIGISSREKLKIRSI